MNGRNKALRRAKKRASPALNVALCSVAGSALYFVCLAIFAALSLKTRVSPNAYFPVGTALGALTGFIGGFAAARPRKEKGAVLGAASGAGQAFITFLALLPVDGKASGGKAAILFAATLAFAVVGGVAAANVKRKRKY